MSIEQLLSQQERENFAQRQLDVLESARHYGLTPENSIVIGGAALALHDLDAYVPEPGIGFDVDAILLQDEGQLRGWRRHLRKAFIPDTAIRHEPEAPLPLTTISGRAALGFIYASGYRDYQAMLNEREILYGTRVLPIAHLIVSKHMSNRFKDQAGLIKAHFIATETDHYMADVEPWQELIAEQIRKIQTRTRPHPNTPPWLTELIQSDFDHPAFRDMPR